MRNIVASSMQLSREVGDLEDLFYFTCVAEFGSFSAASRELGVSKSLLSRHVDALEKKLDVRLMERSTRKLSLTNSGQLLLPHCQVILQELDAARDTMAQVRSSPHGLIRVGCPVSVSLHLLRPRLALFLQRFPDVRIEMVVTNRAIDLYEEGVDLALRVRADLDEPGGVIVKPLANITRMLVASQAFLEKFPIEVPEDLSTTATLDITPKIGRHDWLLQAADGTEKTIEHQPRLVSDDLDMLHETALRGVGVTLLPTFMCRDDLKEGRLVSVLPDWQPKAGTYYAVVLSRKGMRPAIRAFLDFLDETQRQIVEA
ncbi:LysR family transcriptional regulator [Pseudomonas chlororaphis]|uniref:HTH lysR-type domain-containing protein n=1 Tax=Pseudomonas chlororaphis TaxID=587753 RepID=A0A0D5Y1T0_9PSED|nr:LysR family transcriptional regulator [Pseudomonas chlororaphis]AKA25251.1 hypothetical protein PCL1606_38000 [Pseudomonas chlororaphis]